MRLVMVVQDSGAGARKARILVVDDDDEVRMMLVESLRDFGYTVLEAASAEEALPLAMRAQPAQAQDAVELVITDVRMPGMSGLELEQRLRSFDAGLKVIVMSGYFQAEAVPRRFIRKPFRIQDLARAVEDELQ